jgi:tetratricopeptide (TPR) repeat protein
MMRGRAMEPSTHLEGSAPEPGAPAAGLAPATGPAPTRRGAALAAIALLGIAAYANALGGAFVFDDLRLVRDNAVLRELGRVVSLEGLRLFPHRWFAFVTFALDFRLGGPSPWGFHAVNVAIHLGSAALVYALVVLAFRTPRVAGSALAPHARAIGFVAAALFVTHPLQTQAVTYVVQRMTSLATLLYLGAVVVWLRWRLDGPARGPAGALRYGAVLLLALLAMETKEIAFTLPFAIVLAELAFFETTRADLLRLLPVLATAAVVPLTWLLTAGAPLSETLRSAAAITHVQTDLGRLEYLATQLPVQVTYLFLLLLPIGQNLDHDYPIHRSFLDPEVLSAAAVVVPLAVLAAWLWARTRRGAGRPLDPAARLAAFGIAWWFLAHLVESSVIPIVDVVNEHRVYLPTAGLFPAVAVGIAALARRRWEPALAARRTVLAGAVLAVLLGAATFARNRVWASDVSLWTDAARKSPEKSRPWLDLGTALREAGRPEAAIASLRRGLELEPGSVYGRAQLGAVLLSTGRGAEAEPELRAALALAPDDLETLFNYATWLWQVGRRDEARGLYARFAATAPESYEPARRVARARAEAPATPPASDRPAGPALGSPSRTSP